MPSSAVPGGLTPSGTAGRDVPRTVVARRPVATPETDPACYPECRRGPLLREHPRVRFRITATDRTGSTASWLRTVLDRAHARDLDGTTVELIQPA